MSGNFAIKGEGGVPESAKYFKQKYCPESVGGGVVRTKSTK